MCFPIRAGRASATENPQVAEENGVKALVKALEWHHADVAVVVPVLKALRNAALPRGNMDEMLLHRADRMVLRALESLPSDVNVHSRGHRVLLTFVANDFQFAAGIFDRLIEICISAMHRHLMVPEIQISAARVFKGFLSNAGGLHKVVQAGGIEALSTALLTHRSSKELLLQVCGVLLLLMDTDLNRQKLVDGGAVTGLAAVLKSHQEDREVLKLVLKLLLHLADLPEAHSQIVQVGGLQSVVELMRLHLQHAEVQMHGCWIISTIISCDAATEEVCLRVMTYGAVEAVAAAVTAHPLDIQLQLRCCGVVASMAYASGDAAKVAQLGGAQAVVAAMVGALGEAEIQCQGCWALLNLCKPELEARRHTIHAGGLAAVISGMRAHRHVSQIQSRACWVLSLLAFDTETQELASKAGAVENVLQALREHRSDEAVHKRGCEALQCISAAGGTVRNEAVKQGAMQAVVVSMREHPRSADVQHKGCGALHNLATGAVSSKIQLAALGGIDLVVAAMEQFPDIGAVQHQGCWALAAVAFNGENQEKVAGAGGVEVVVKSMVNHYADVEVQHAGCWALVNIAGVHAHVKQRAVDAGAIRVCRSALQVFKTNTAIQQKARLAMSILSQ
ncbi:hypothetical protein CYMTET_47849 [Cymbomonas tetramitiformis]|uniref:LRRK2 ARM repeat domain-containing protein n=1 Tax=Cymbomonas tetramitiformis TaxID=36881 RepID=A0AAE0EW80_9CHLO|nr:hypothetical protein CYMTET_47849 [Cymbomonas tetramitiformis]